ncbi:MAG TPA: polynucleotide adenylyltransferase, partial [Planctomycetota bacterium]|nr:polynucleotide adenylyltransferase [Planctomycetota bacterium]
RVAKADSLGRRAPGAPEPHAEGQDWFIERARSLGVQKEGPKPILLGRHVLAMGLSPGPRIGEITEAVYQLQLEGEVRTLEEAQAAARRLLP